MYGGQWRVEEMAADFFRCIRDYIKFESTNWVLDRVALRGCPAGPGGALRLGSGQALRQAQGERIDFGHAEVVEARYDPQSALTDCSNTHE
jgi:hypothetical protein